jgi:tRNA modification GTPase
MFAMNDQAEDTIAAIATPPGKGGIALVRISGADTFSIVDKIFAGTTKVSDAESHTVHFGRIVGNQGDVIDEVLVTVFKSPRSYTSEDMVEIGCHGGRVVADEVLNAVMKAGARHAERGEFTKRAFLLGRIDLAQAEAVMQMVSAPSGRAVRVAAQQLKGVLSDRVNEIADGVVAVLGDVGARLDFPEDIEGSYHLEETLSKLDDLIAATRKLSATSEIGQRIQDGINVAIVGPPNAGKSSVFNRILDNDRAIVSDRPGTTRDFIKETIGWRGWSVNLIDTAGLSSGEDELELEGMERTWRCIDACDVVLLVVDGTLELSESPAFFERLPMEATAIVVNKADGDVSERTRKLVDDHGLELFEFSCKDGRSPDPILNAVTNLYSGLSEAGSELAIVVNKRHSELLRRALRNLMSARSIMAGASGDELASFELREALDVLAAVTGRNLSTEVVNRVFDDFCVGK